MDETQQSFTLRGRIYYLDIQQMEIIQYYKSYSTTPQIACDALGYNIDMYSWDTPEVRLYENYIDIMTTSTIDDEKKYIKAKLWSMIDSTGIRATDIIKACEMLLSLSNINTDNTANLKDLSYEQLLQLMDKLK